VTSSNEAVLPAANVTSTGDGAERTVGFAPVGRGTTTLTFTAEEPGGTTSSATLTYAASNAAPDPAGRYLHGVSDASSALDVGDGYVLIASDETNTILLYSTAGTGAPVKTWTFTSSQLGTSSEIDIEGVARSGDTLVWIGSHGNNRDGEVREERRTLFATTIAGSGAATELTFAGRFTSLWEQLLEWDETDGHGLGADALGLVAAAAPGVLPNAPDGFNLEGFEFAPDGTTGYLGFRGPTVDEEGQELALIVPVTNVLDLDDQALEPTSAQFGAPILLDLGGRSIRELRRNDDGDYLVSAGPSPSDPGWALYAWDGDPENDAAFVVDLPAEDALTGGTWESIATVPHPIEAGAKARLVTDSGDTNFYGTGQTKDLAPLYQKSYVRPVTLADPATDPDPEPSADEVLARRAYEVVLGRTADAAGLEYWAGRLAAGTPPLTVMESLARSGEGRGRLVTEAYLAVLDRPADAGGRAYWAERLRGGLSAEELVAHLVASGEGLTAAGGTADGVVQRLYQVHLGRAADAGGLAFWADRLEASGTSAGRRTASLAIGRTPEAGAVALRRATTAACGADAPVPADGTAFLARDVATGRDQVRLRGAVLALHCPEAP
jgi:hypothetical protein